MGILRSICVRVYVFMSSILPLAFIGHDMARWLGLPLMLCCLRFPLPIAFCCWGFWLCQIVVLHRRSAHEVLYPSYVTDHCHYCSPREALYGQLLVMQVWLIRF